MPMKLDFDDSFEILAKNRSKILQRRTLSNVVDLNTTNLHQKSLSSHLPTLAEELQLEISKIKEEVEARCLEQKQRELLFDSILGNDLSLATEDIQLHCNISQETVENKDVGVFFCCKSWFFKCFQE